MNRAIFIISSAEEAPSQAIATSTEATTTTTTPSTTEEEDGSYSWIKSVFKTHHIESSSDFFNHLQQVICLAPGMRLVYRTNFAGMYNDISQVVYFHHPKFTKQPQLKLQEILLSSINSLPLVTQLFPQLQVFYDDDSYIPFLSDKKRNTFYSTTLSASSSSTTASTKHDEMESIDDFVHKQMEEKRRQESLQNSKMQMDDAQAEEADMEDNERYCWLICCSSIFLIDILGGRIFASHDASIIPLLAYMANDPKATIGKSLRDQSSHGSLDPQTLLKKAAKIDLGTAHGHVCFI